MGVGLHRVCFCPNSMNIHLKSVHVTVYKFYRKDRKQPWTLNNDMHADVFRKKCIDVCNFFGMHQKKNKGVG